MSDPVKSARAAFFGNALSNIGIFQKKKESGLSTKEIEKFKGTEFMLVGVGSGSSDPSGKLQILQHQINLHDGWKEREQVQKAVARYER